MARQHANGNISGQISRVVYYVVNGKGYMRAAADRVRQTEATKACSQVFGQSKQIGRVLREQITGRLPNLQTMQVMRRFDPALYHWLRLGNRNGFQEKLPHLDRFEFNPQSLLLNKFRNPFVVNFTDPGKVHLTIPEFHLPSEGGAPSKTEMFHWHVLVTSGCIGKNEISDSIYRSFDNEFKTGTFPPQTLTFDVKPQEEALRIVVVALRYTVFPKGTLILVEDPAWLPTAVVGCCYYGKH